MSPVPALMLTLHFLDRLSWLQKPKRNQLVGMKANTLGVKMLFQEVFLARGELDQCKCLSFYKLLL